MSVKELTKPRNLRQDVWDLLRNNRERFQTVDEISAATGSNYSAVYAYLRCLFNGGYIGIQQGFRFSRRLGYRLERDTGAEAPRLRADGSMCNGTVIEAMWRTMKILRHFDIDTLVSHVNMTHRLTRNMANRYTAALECAGYLTNTGSPRFKKFTLVKNTGAKAPQMVEVHELYDPNLDEIILREVPDYE
ncbi:hypothetical protein ACFPVS_09210 [Neisseria weixii]|uniref:hypothetical protein n=1 Tax=Neisseria weixii TaxID=1853276 RepID=UPI003616CD0C